MMRYASGEEPMIGDFVRRVNGRGVINGDDIGEVVRITSHDGSVDVKWRGQFSDGTMSPKIRGSWQRWTQPKRLNLVRRSRSRSEGDD